MRVAGRVTRGGMKEAWREERGDRMAEEEGAGAAEGHELAAERAAESSGAPAGAGRLQAAGEPLGPLARNGREAMEGGAASAEGRERRTATQAPQRPTAAAARPTARPTAVHPGARPGPDTSLPHASVGILRWRQSHSPAGTGTYQMPPGRRSTGSRELRPSDPCSPTTSPPTGRLPRHRGPSEEARIGYFAWPRSPGKGPYTSSQPPGRRSDPNARSLPL